MSRIKFERVCITKVKLDGKYAGDIKEVTGGWTYFPKGSKKHGDIFKSRGEVIKSLKD